METATLIINKFSWVIVTFAIAGLLLATVVMLVRSRGCRADGAFYEHFESGDDWNLSAIRSRISKIKAMKDEILAYGESVGELADETCSIMKTVEDTYIKNGSQPSNDSEFALPRAEQEAAAARRRTLASKRWIEQKELYSAVNGQKPLLECFYAGKEDVAAAESELNKEITELEQILDTAQVRAAVLKRQRIDLTLNFTQPYLQDAVKSIEPFEVVVRSGAALLSRADELLGKAESIKSELAAIRTKIDRQQSLVKILRRRQTQAPPASSMGADLTGLETKF